MKKYFEKIKVNLSYNSYSSIFKDIGLFNFQKINHFLNCLCENYYNILHDRKSNIIKYLQTVLNEYIKEENKIINMADTLNAFLNTTYNDDNYNYHHYDLYIRPTNATRKLFDYIFLNELNNISLSVFIRNLINEYLKLVQFQREQIVHLKTYNNLNIAISNGRITVLTLENKNIYFAPFKHSINGSDTFNYFIGKNLQNDKIESYKLSDIKSITIINEKHDFTNKEIEEMSDFIDSGIEFASENIIIAKILLTEEGITKFNKIYTNRPFSTHNEENIYFFKSTEQNLLEYFVQFGNNAIILEPENVKNQFIDFYENVLNAYKVKN